MEVPTIEQIINPVHSISSILGSTPYEIKNEEMRFSKCKLFYSAFIITLYTVLAVLTGRKFQYDLDEELTQIKTITFVLMLQSAGIFSLLFLALGSIWTKSQKFINQLNKIVKIDTELFKYGLRDEVAKAGWKQRKYLIILLVFIDLNFNILRPVLLVYGCLVEPEWFHVPAIAYPRLVITNMNLVFYLAMMMLQKRFKIINNIIQEKVDESKKVAKYPNSEDFCKELNSLISIHKTLTTISQTINSIYSLHLLLWIGINFGSLVGDLYIVFYVILFDKFGDHSFFFITLMNNFLMYTFDLFFIAKRCGDLCSEANRTKNILVSMKIDIDMEDERNAVITSTLKLMQNKLEITACNLFSIDNALLFSICGAASSYLFIMVQLDLGNQKNNGTATTSP